MSTFHPDDHQPERWTAFAADRQLKLLFAGMVVVGYVITFVLRANQDLPPLATWELLLGSGLYLLYLLVGLNASEFATRLHAELAAVLFFSIECALILGSGLTLGTGGSWLMAMPLAGFAVELLEPRQRWVVYIVTVACTVLPLGLQQGSWLGALFNAVTVGTAVAFVAIFAQMRLNEQQARERVEQLMLDLERANAQLSAYATQAEELAMTQERNRLAREIHDNLGHTLTVVNVQIEAAKAVMETEPERALNAMGKVQDLVHNGLHQVRQSVAALRESPVSNRPLDEAISDLLSEVESSGIVAEFEVTGEPLELEHKLALALYRTAQEGLTNVCRHARASRVDVSLDFQPDEVCLEVRDNGMGAAQVKEGFGLLGIRERMRLLGGRMEVDTGTGLGFNLMARVPVYRPDAPSQPEA